MCIWYCNIAAAKVVLDRHPNCLSQRDSVKGQLPLHVACEENNESEQHKSKLIELLLLTGVKQNVGGMFGAGGLYVRDNKGNTPLMQLLQCMNNPFAWDERLLTLSIRVAFEAGQSQVMEGLLEMDERSHIDDDFDEQPDPYLYFPILHEAMNVSSPDVFYRIIEIVKEYDVELAGVDRRGRTALIKAIYLDNEEQQIARNQSMSMSSMGSMSMTMMMTPKYTQKTSTKEIIGMVVGAVQSSCAMIRDGAGRLPLHIATEMGLKWNEGIRDIVYANRHGLREQHCVTGLYSFMTAASVPNADLDTIYNLMRVKPKLVKVMNDITVGTVAVGTNNADDDDSDDESSPIIGSVFSFHKPPVHGPLVPNATWDTAPDEDSPSAKTMSTFQSMGSVDIEAVTDTSATLLVPEGV